MEDVNQLFEGQPLLGAIMSPDRLEHWWVSLFPEEPEQVLETTIGLPEGITFDVEENVSVRGLG